METKPVKIKTPKKRFTSRDQIIAKIDKFTAKAKKQRDFQTQCYRDANDIRRLDAGEYNPHMIQKAKARDQMGDAWGNKAYRLENDVLKRLRSKLAEFDTQTIPGITTDRSVMGI